MPPVEWPRSPECSAILARVKDLEAIPGQVAAMLQAIDDPDSSPNAIAAELRQDQAVLAIILRTANSAYYKASGQVRDITEAIVVLGLSTIRQLIVAQLGRLVLRRNDSLQEGLWHHALASSVAAQSCARAVRGVTVSHAFTAAILHDIGKAVMHEADPEAYARVWGLASTDSRRSQEVEREHFGTDHTEVGAELLKAWNLPEMYGIVTRFHHSPDLASGVSEKDRRLLHIVVLADDVALALGHGGREARPITELRGHPMLERLGASDGLLDQLANDVGSELENAVAMFG